MSEPRALVFDSEEALLAALTSGLIPDKIRDAGVGFFRGPDGAIGVVPDKRPSRSVVAALVDAGVTRGAPPPQLSRAACWPAVIAPRKTAADIPAQGAIALLVIRGEQSLLSYTGELHRLGCDRLSYQLVAPRSGGDRVALIRAFEPPYYTIARAGEPGAMCQAFVPMPSGQTRTWIELGYEHPLVGAVTPPVGTIGVISGDGEWRTFPDGPWRDVFEFVEVTVPGDARAWTATALNGKLAVPLSLTRATREAPPSLWVLRDDPIAQVDALVRAVPDDITARLSFAVLRDAAGGEAVVLRARAGRAGPPAIDVAGVAYVPYLGVPNLYVPATSSIEPPLRRDTLRALLAADADQLTWLAPTGGGGFRAELAAADAFAPLVDWVDYTIDAAAETLAPWVRSTSFSFASFRSSGREWADADEPEPAPTREPAPPRRAQRAQTEPAPQPEPPPPEPPPRPARAPTQEPRRVSRDDDIQQSLGRLERQFLDLDAPADAPERLPLWVAMGQHHAALGNARDAALCFVRALWERTDEGALRVVQVWQRSDPPPRGARGLWHAARAAQAPSVADVRSAVVHWIRTLLPQVIAPPDPDRTFDTEIERELLDVQAWLDAHDGSLDARSSWLIRVAIAHVVGGDPLGLARVRDRLLNSLRDGLSMERDVPTFLRFLGSGAGDSAAVAQLADNLDLVVAYCERNQPARPINAESTYMNEAYMRLVFAWGFARLGRTERAAELRAQAESAFGDRVDDVIHGYLVRAYGARIDQALAGEPMLSPMPSEVTALLDDMPKMAGYKADKLREESTILEPQQRLDSYQMFLARLRHSVEEVSPLRGLDGDALAAEVDRLLARALAADTPVEDRARMLDRLMDHFPKLHEAQAIQHLRVIVGAVGDVPPPHRALLLEEALMLAGFFGQITLAAEIARALRDLVRHLQPADAATIARAFSEHLGSLRRVGLTEEATELLDALAATVEAEGAAGLEARLYLAAGLGFLGRFSHAEPVIADAQRALESGAVANFDRPRIVRGLAHAWSQAPQEHALRGLAELARLLPETTDTLSTNSHFCLSALSFVEALVLGYARSDLALGETGRRWLDDDEYLVRRRIHREFARLTSFSIGAGQ